MLYCWEWWLSSMVCEILLMMFEGDVDMVGICESLCIDVEVDLVSGYLRIC